MPADTVLLRRLEALGKVPAAALVPFAELLETATEEGSAFLWYQLDEDDEPTRRQCGAPTFWTCREELEAPGELLELLRDEASGYDFARRKGNPETLEEWLVEVRLTGSGGEPTLDRRKEAARQVRAVVLTMYQAGSIGKDEARESPEALELAGLLPSSTRD